MTPQPDPDDPPYEMAYRSLTEKDDEGVEIYEGDLTHGLTLVVGDQYWDKTQRHLLTIRDVVTRVRLDTHGEEMSAGPKYVQVESDHPKHLEGMNDGTMVLSLEDFCMKVLNDTFVPHDANGYRPPQLRK